MIVFFFPTPKKKMFLLFFFYFIFLLGYVLSLDYYIETIKNPYTLGFYIFLLTLNLSQTFFLNYKFFTIYSSFYYKSVIGINILFFIINLIMEYTGQENIIIFFFQIMINIFNIIYILPKDIYIYDEINERRGLSSNEDYPEATYL